MSEETAENFRKKILRMKQVIEKTGKSESTIFTGVADGSFPAPISLGGRSKGWLESEIDEWLAAKINERAEKKSGVTLTELVRIVESRGDISMKDVWLAMGKGEFPSFAACGRVRQIPMAELLPALDTLAAAKAQKTAL